MNIAYICSDKGIPVFGQKGASLHVQEMINAFLQLHHDVTLFARRTGGEAPSTLVDVRVESLPKLSSDDPAELERLAIASNADTARLLREQGPFDLIYERYSLWSHAGLSEAKAMGAVTVLEVNAPLISEQKTYRYLNDEQAAIHASQQAFEAADVIVAVSEEVAVWLARFPQTRNKVRVLPNGVNYDRYRPFLPRVANRRKPLTLGFLGTLKPWHGVDCLLQAYALIVREIPESRLRIIGDGPERENLEALCVTLGIADHVSFTGAVTPSQVPHQLGEMDIGIAPYPKLDEFYFSPLKIYEYMASGLPVIASDIGQIRQLIAHEQTGLLTPAGDIDAIANAVIWLHRNPQESNRIARNGQSKVLREHTWSAIAGQVLDAAGFPAPESPRSVSL